MGFKDWFGKGKKAVADNADSVKDAVDKGADFVDDKTGGKFSDQIDSGAEAAKDAIDNLTDDA